MSIGGRTMTQTQVNNPDKRMILVCCGTGCLANGSGPVYEAFCHALEGNDQFEVETFAKATGCNGLCEKGPLVKILPDDITYCHVKEEDVSEIVEQTLLKGELVNRLLYRDPATKQYYRSHHDTNFYKKQHKVALRNIGEIDPTAVQDYLDRDGYRALKKAVKTMTPGEVVEEVLKAGLRGRGGGIYASKGGYVLKTYLKTMFYNMFFYFAYSKMRPIFASIT